MIENCSLNVDFSDYNRKFHFIRLYIKSPHSPLIRTEQNRPDKDHPERL